MGMRRTTGARPIWWQAVAVALGTGLLAVACGSSSPSASGTSPSGTASASPTATSLVCQDAADLRTSLRNLTHSDVSQGGVTEIKSNLAQVHTDLTALITHAKGQWQAQTSALKAALATLQTAVSDLSSSPSATTVAGVATALREVAGAGGSLLTAISTKCPSASPS
jgi:hypothetical protein